MGRLEQTPGSRSSSRDRENAERTNAYLEDKLALFSNLKVHFDGIAGLKDILGSFLSSYPQSKNRVQLKHDTKARLVQAGVFNDEEVLEFLLLISEKERTFAGRPRNVGDEDLCRYYFGKYRSPDEQWPPTEFNFWFKRTHSYQTERARVLEEVAIFMIVNSRARLEKAIKPTPKDIARLIGEVDSYFQKAFSLFFGVRPPLSLADVTQVTREYIEHANRVSGKTFIDVDDYYRDRKQFAYLVIHEALHLCFMGFDEKEVEEALIEDLIEKMSKKYPSPSFSYSPVSDTYQSWKGILRSLYRVLPDAERHFTKYFLTSDIGPLSNYLKSHLIDQAIERMKTEHYVSGISGFIASVKRLTN